MPKKEEDKKRVKVKVVEETDNEKEKSVDEVKTEVKKDTIETTKEKESTIKNKEEPKEESKKEPSEEKHPESDKLPFWILFFAFLIGLTLGAGLIGGIFYYKSKVEGTISIGTKPSSTIAPDINGEENIEATTEPEIELSSYSVQILNGSGVKGGASEVELIINDAGFDNTSTGNADSYEYTSTEVSFKSSVSNEAKEIIKDSLNDYEIETNDELSDTSEYDVVVIVGSS